MSQPVVNLLPTIAPKSDQLNADDLIGGRSLVIKVTSVKLCGEPDQPFAIHFEGDNGKPYKPCKSMRRVMVHVWGADGNAYVGRRMALYRDDKVLFGGVAVGGIRISHMSHIDKEITMALTATKAQRKPFTVKPLPAETGDAPKVDVKAILATGEAAAKEGSARLSAWWEGLSKAEKIAAKPSLDERLKPIAAQADTAGADPDPDDEPSFGAPAPPMLDGDPEPTFTDEPPQSPDLADATFDPLDWAASFTRGLDALETADEVAASWATAKTNGFAFKLQAANPGMFEALKGAVDARKADLSK